jgi:drug/metabolite transporter (DMT)-like permease
MHNRSELFRIYPVLFLGVICISTGAIFARLAEAPPLVIAAYRVGIASVILLPFAFMKRRKEIGSLAKRDWTLLAASGVFLAMHFYFWISSLEFTSVAASVVLVNTNPLWAALAAPLIGDRLRPLTIPGIFLSFLGASVIGWSDGIAGGLAIKGDILALAGAVMLTAYLFAGRMLRKKISLLTYVSLCYGVAAILLWIMVFATGTSCTGFSSFTWAMFPAMAIIPQILGHSSYNWALKYLSAPLVAVSLLGEPVGSSVLAWIFLNETPGPPVLAGGICVLAGIVLAARSEQQDPL